MADTDKLVKVGQLDTVADAVIEVISDTNEVISDTNERLLNAFPTDTATGAIASFTDGADNLPLKSLVIGIEPKQSGSGDPSPTNVRPISGWTGAQVVRCGINIWDEECELGTIRESDGYFTPDSTRIRSKNLNPCAQNTSYYVKDPTNNNDISVRWYGKDKEFVSSTSWIGNTNIQSPVNAYYFAFVMASAYGTTYNHDISINYPATDTDYHEGHVQSITISLGQTVYGGTLDVLNGVLTVDRAVVDLGALDWSLTGEVFYSSSAPFFGQGGNVLVSNDAKDICEIYKYGIVTISNPQNNQFYVTNSQAVPVLRVSDNRFANTADFKTAMNGIKAVFELYQPTTYQLTPTEVESLLGANNIYCDTGATSAEYRADPTLYINKKIAEAISALS